ncbi:hypothetical protein B0H34DRAFT_821249 [Crassisporium funariophilum]|nr:hypothetical protein B0H34DRAFT_821249 [Crassisporium funariophilum]
MTANQTPKYKITTALTAVESIQAKEEDTAELKAYTDGAIQDGMVGAAAILYRKGRTNPIGTLRYQLGPDKEPTVTEAETVGGILAMWLLRGINEVQRTPSSIYTDSRAFQQILQKRRPKSGAHLITMLTKTTEEAAKKYAITGNHPRFNIHWIASHRQVPGNEQADKEAKKAAREGSLPTYDLPPALRKTLPVSIHAVKRRQLKELNTEWEKGWSKSQRRPWFVSVDPKFPFKKHRQMVTLLTRAQSSLLVQIQTRHIPLNGYLHRLQKADHARCKGCWNRSKITIKEMVHHYLFECPEHRVARSKMESTLGREAMDLQHILQCRQKIGTLLKFIGESKRLQISFGDVSTNET